MIVNFFDFNREGLILEAELNSNSEFLSRIKKTNKTKIGNILYSLFLSQPFIDRDLPYNYIDVYSEDEISFLSDSRYSRILDGDGYTSPYLANGRGTMKIGRFVSALLKDEKVKEKIGDVKFTDKELEEFVNVYKSTSSGDDKKFKLVKGDEIAYWYNKNTYADLRGSLGGSCMKNVDPSFFDIYAKNDVCEMLILVDNYDKLLGRALVWKLNESPCGAEYFMDRVYVSNDADVLRFIQYAKREKWLYKYKMTAHYIESVLFYHGQTPVLGKIVVKLKEINFDSYPFLDTICFLNKKENTLSNVGQPNDIILGSSEGSTESCSLCGGSGKYRCSYCSNFDKNCTRCLGISKCPECTGVLEHALHKIKNGQYPPFK